MSVCIRYVHVGYEVQRIQNGYLKSSSLGRERGKLEERLGHLSEGGHGDIQHNPMQVYSIASLMHFDGIYSREVCIRLQPQRTPSSLWLQR